MYFLSPTAQMINHYSELTALNQRKQNTLNIILQNLIQIRMFTYFKYGYKIVDYGKDCKFTRKKDEKIGILQNINDAPARRKNFAK